MHAARASLLTVAATCFAACAAGPDTAAVVGIWQLDAQAFAAAMDASIEAYVAGVPEAERDRARNQLGALRMRRSLEVELRADGSYRLASEIAGSTINDTGAWAMHGDTVRLESQQRRPTTSFVLRDGCLCMEPDADGARIRTRTELTKAIRLRRATAR